MRAMLFARRAQWQYDHLRGRQQGLRLLPGQIGKEAAARHAHSAVVQRVGHQLCQLLVAAVALGRDHPALAESRAFAAVERLEELAADRAGAADALPAVGAPPPARSR